MNKARLLGGVLALAALLVPPSAVLAGGNPTVSYTWTLAALGQGGWVGGPLFADGSAGGGGALSVGDGQLVERFQPTTWTEPADGVIRVCLDVSAVKPAGGPGGAQLSGWKSR